MRTQAEYRGRCKKSRETVLTVVAFLVISPEQYKGGGKKDPCALLWQIRVYLQKRFYCDERRARQVLASGPPHIEHPLRWRARRCAFMRCVPGTINRGIEFLHWINEEWRAKSFVSCWRVNFNLVDSLDFEYNLFVCKSILLCRCKMFG